MQNKNPIFHLCICSNIQQFTMRRQKFIFGICKLYLCVLFLFTLFLTHSLTLIASSFRFWTKINCWFFVLYTRTSTKFIQKQPTINTTTKNYIEFVSQISVIFFFSCVCEPYISRTQHSAANEKIKIVVWEVCAQHNKRGDDDRKFRVMRDEALPNDYSSWIYVMTGVSIRALWCSLIRTGV